MKTTIKLFLLVTLFCSVTIADDGDMGNGSRTCTQNCPGIANQIGSEDETTITSSDDSILSSVQEYLNSLVGYIEN